MPCPERNSVARRDAIGVATLAIDVQFDRYLRVEQSRIELDRLVRMKGIVNFGT